MKRTSALASLIAVVAAVPAASVPAAAAAAAPGPRAGRASADSDYRVVRLRNLNSGRCMGAEGGTPANGTRVIQWTCTGSGDQAWYVNFDGSYSEVVNFRRGPGSTDACLGVSGGVTTQGAQMVTWQCDGKANQQWRVEGSSECGGVILVNASAGMLASVEGRSTANGASVIQWPHGSTRDQTWCVE
ncbi:RICIN domain-containing protein [Actinoplanes sp. NPDC049265]|uniref:RICIN domain-containing protein n=1 Tax=Actinoplanes sp. NPDC049265 TaxID=3363902 RepID=UPI00371C3F5A